MSYDRKCLGCQKTYVSVMPHSKTCSVPCRTKIYLEKSGRFAGANKDLPSGTVGAITELVVASELMKKGYAVFRALSPACFCDLIAIKGERVMNVEARTGYRNTLLKTLSYPRKTKGNVDCFGIYERNEGKVYFLDLDNKELII